MFYDVIYDSEAGNWYVEMYDREGKEVELSLPKFAFSSIFEAFRIMYENHPEAVNIKVIP